MRVATAHPGELSLKPAAAVCAQRVIKEVIMKIAQIAPLHESVPPQLYGGTERVVAYLTEELVRQGHDVTLFASADSQTLARLEPVVAKGLRLDPACRDPLAHHVVMFDRVARAAPAFDVLHFHTDYLHFPLTRCLRAPHLTTLHGRLDLPDLQAVFRQYNELPVVSISDSQRAPLPFANWLTTVYNGIPADLYRFQPESGDYLAFLGRISPEKGVDRAIEIACRAGVSLRIAAKVDPVDQAYFDQRIRPLLRHPLIDYIGEIGDADKGEFLGGARALLFPINWPEPFGLVMIEAMACGTPVIAWHNGAVPEVMKDGITGFIVGGIEAAVEAVDKVGGVDRHACRQAFERRFSAQRMAQDYAAAYRALLERVDPTPIAV